jgi:hypothetical protein
MMRNGAIPFWTHGTLSVEIRFSLVLKDSRSLCQTEAQARQSDSGIG